MKQVYGYVCEKCGYYALGEKNAKKVQAHERVPVTGRCNSLDGLIVKVGHKQNYLVIRPTSTVTQNHELVYDYDEFRNPTLNKITPISDVLERLHVVMFELGFRGFTANQIVDTTLYTRSADSFDHELYKNYAELSKKEFKRVTSSLKRRYPALYANTEFKRELKRRRRIL